jgi:hypothetical protein
MDNSSLMFDGRSVLDDWCERAGPEWDIGPSGQKSYRLLYRGSSVLFCYNRLMGITVFVEHLTEAESDDVLRYGTSRMGYQPDRKGIRLVVEPDRIGDVLEWTKRHWQSSSWARNDGHLC